MSGKVLALRYVDDRAVTEVKLLRKGDHIIFTSKSVPYSCKECHAIVLDTIEDEEGEIKEQMQVIRYAHGELVWKDWIPFEKPLYRVEYPQKLDPEKVIQNANMKLEDAAYQLTVDDCEQFARECITGEQNGPHVPG